MKKAGAGKWLTDKPGAGKLAVAGDELTVGLLRKQQMGDAGDQQGIADAEDESRYNGVEHGGDEKLSKCHGSTFQADLVEQIRLANLVKQTWSNKFS